MRLYQRLSLAVVAIIVYGEIIFSVPMRLIDGHALVYNP